MAKRKIDRSEAITMRKFGFTYKQIANILDCSEQWCASNLSNIKPNDEFLVEAYLKHRMTAKDVCYVCQAYFNYEDGVSVPHPSEYDMGMNVCSMRCMDHYHLEGEELKEVLGGKDYNKF